MTCVGDNKRNVVEVSNEVGQLFAANKYTREARVSLVQPYLPFVKGEGNEETSGVDEPIEEYH